MQYKATIQREVIVPFMLLTLLLLTQGPELFWYKIFCLFIIVLHLAALFINYSFSIEEDQMIYKIFFANFQLYQKIVGASHIKKVIFKRANWKTKVTIIKLNKGFSIRIMLFKPDTVFNELTTFCEKNDIQYNKTRDYKILEKLR